MERITQKDLEYLVKRINEVTDSPQTSYTKTRWGHIANIDNYHLDYAYGGVQLSRMVNKDGGVTTISRPCHVPKRELYNWMNAYLTGLTQAEINIPS